MTVICFLSKSPLMNMKPGFSIGQTPSYYMAKPAVYNSLVPGEAVNRCELRTVFPELRSRNCRIQVETSHL